MVPPILGATKPCVFVHGSLNQEALSFNVTTDPTIGGMSREDWRIHTVQVFTHEVQHVIFDSAAHPALAGCPRSLVENELSELNAIISEFPPVFRASPTGSTTTDTRLRRWFDTSVDNTGESIRGILTKMRCQCSCTDVDAYVRETFNFVSGSWSAAERNAFNAELRLPARSLSWPL
jgi:hypothetical protein